MKLIHNKLVRDKIPEIINQAGKECKIKILNDDKYIIDVNEAITNYFNEEKESYIEDIDRVKVDINQDYDFVIIKITI